MDTAATSMLKASVYTTDVSDYRSYKLITTWSCVTLEGDRPEHANRSSASDGCHLMSILVTDS